MIQIEFKKNKLLNTFYNKCFVFFSKLCMLSKRDIELLTVTLDDYIFYAKNDGGPDTGEVERFLHRLEDHLNKF